MTLMAIDSTQSQAHKGNFLQGGKVSNINHHQPNVNRNSHSPPLSKQQQHCNNNNNNQHYNDSSNRKLERSSSDSSSEGSRSSRSSQSSNSNNNSSRYKTELCRPFEESGVCKYGDKCQFAHGSKELRTLVRHPKYKTELCRTFHSTGLCPYGPRCHFIHNSEQTKKKLLTNLTRNSSPTEAKSFNDLYQNNVFLGPMDNLMANYQHQQQRCSSSSFEYKSDLYDAINGYNDKVFYDKDVDNYSFQNGPVLELVPAQELVPPPSPQEREVGFTASMLLPIFNAFQKRAIA